MRIYPKFSLQNFPTNILFGKHKIHIRRDSILSEIIAWQLIFFVHPQDEEVVSAEERKKMDIAEVRLVYSRYYRTTLLLMNRHEEVYRYIHIESYYFQPLKITRSVRYTLENILCM